MIYADLARAMILSRWPKASKRVVAAASDPLSTFGPDVPTDVRGAVRDRALAVLHPEPVTLGEAPLGYAPLGGAWRISSPTADWMQWPHDVRCLLRWADSAAVDWDGKSIPYRASDSVFPFSGVVGADGRSPCDLAAGAVWIHERWAAKRDSRLPHPIGPLVESARDRAVTVAPDRKPIGIMPSASTGVPNVLFHAHELTDDEAYGGGAVTDLSFADAGYLPGLEPQPSAIVPCYPVAVFDRTADRATIRGAAPVFLRVLHELVTAVPLRDRGDDVRIAKPARELMAGVWAGDLSHPARKLRVLRYALFQAHNARLDCGDVEWAPVTVKAMPKHPDAPVIVDIEKAPGASAGSGGAFSRAVLRGFAGSFTLYRGYLGLVGLRNKYGTHRGKLMPTYVPDVTTDASGAVLDVTGNPIVDSKGRPVRSRWHPLAKAKAWTARRIVNPAIPMPWLDDDDLLRLFMPPIPRDATNPRIYLKRARAAVDDLERKGFVVVIRECPDAPTQRGKGRYRIYLTELPDGRLAGLSAMPAARES